MKKKRARFHKRANILYRKARDQAREWVLSWFTESGLENVFILFIVVNFLDTGREEEFMFDLKCKAGKQEIQKDQSK